MEKINEIISKLSPENFSGMSDLMSAILGYIFDRRFNGNKSSFVRIYVLNQLVIGINDVGERLIIGSEEDLNNNWNRLLDAAGCSDEEKESANCIFSKKISRSCEN